MYIGINQKTSPLKFCFLIKPNSKSRFERAVEVCNSIWGGIYSPILQLYKNMPKSYREEYDISLKTKIYYQNSIRNFDPDIIIYDEDLNFEYIKSLIDDQNTFTTTDFIEKLKRNDIPYGISIIKILSSLLNKEFKFKRNDNLKFQLENFENNLFLNMFFGKPIDLFYERINDGLKGKSFYENPKINISDLDKFYPNGNLSTIDLNSYKIRSYPERHWYRGNAVYFINDSRLNDLNNYWNLRSMGWNIIPMPIGELKNKYFQNILEKYTYHQKRRFNGLSFIGYLISNSTSVKQKQDIDDLLKNTVKKLKLKELNFTFQGWFPRYWEERSILEADKTICERTQVDYSYEHIDIEDNYVRAKAKPLPFKFDSEYNSNVTYKIDLFFSYFDEYANNAGLVYGINSLDWIRLTHSFSADKWKLSSTGLSYYVRRDDDDISFHIPKALDFFKIYFSKSGNNLMQTANGQLANQVLKNIGGIRGSYFLKNLGSLKVLQLFEDGKIITYPQLIGEVKKNLRIKNNEDAQYYVKNLIDNRIIEFGAKIQCSICFQRSFYLVSQLENKLTCNVCHNDYRLPTNNPKEINWAYRGIGPFSKNNKVGGLMSVFLTLKLFNREFADTSGNISSLIGFELEKKNQNLKEVDLAVLLQERNDDGVKPDLFLCECKTLKNFTEKDSNRMIELGEEFPNSILTFSTLKEELLEEEKNEIKKVVNHFRKGVGNRPRNPILILTAKELLPEDFFDHFREYKDKAKPYHRHNDWIGNLSEFTIEKHLELKSWGELRSELWVKEMKERNKKNAPQHNV